MGIWDDIVDDAQNQPSEPENPYLADPKKGMQLIAKLLPNRQHKTFADKVAGRLDYMLDNEILPTLRDLGGNTIALSRQLTKLSDKIMEYKKIRLLSGKSIVGMVGRFSAGKSRFINSLLKTADNRIILPEDQNPTTSIPTYIVGGTVEKIQAYSGGRTVDLDLDAMQAMTHKFYEEYAIGFSRFVGNLAIYTPFFPPRQKNRIVFLDTPGYNKPDVNTRENLTDEHIAEQQVKAADFLILLVTAEDGIIGKDIDFICRVATKNPLLVVVNKADKSIESDCRKIIENVRQTLTDKGINFFGITAYSSRDGKEYFGQNLVENFLDYAAQQSAENHEVEAELMSLTKSIRDDFDKEIHAASERRHDLGNELYKAADIRAINSLAHIYGRVCQKYGRLRGNRKNFNKIVGKIHANFAELIQGE